LPRLGFRKFNKLKRDKSSDTSFSGLAAIPILVSFFAYAVTLCHAQQAKRPFTVVDEIGLIHFGDPYSGGVVDPVQFSPDGNYFAVYSERGRLDVDRVEDSLRFYRSKDVKGFLEHSTESQPPSPVWVVNRSADKGLVIKDWRWLADSSGVAFLEPTTGGNRRLVLVNLRKKRIEALTSATEAAEAFDVRDRQHYVYTVAESTERRKLQDELQAPAMVGTGRSIYELILPDDPKTFSPRRNHLWAVVDGKRFEVKKDGAPLVPNGDFALSPDGVSFVAKLRVPEIPPSWKTLYPLANASDRLLAASSVNQYARINLQTGSVEPLVDAPESADLGWEADGTPSWSNDGQQVLLPGTFLKSKENAPSRPCVAVVDLLSDTSTCIEIVKKRTESGVEEGFHWIWDARFVDGDKQRVMVLFMSPDDATLRTTEYRRAPDSTWHVVREIKGAFEATHEGLDCAVKQWFNEPPVLVATNKEASRIIWNPNPQLKDFELGEASVYTWKDKEGRDRRGVLYKPSNYKAGQPYPLVIQTHGFFPSAFKPSGVYPTAFAARALAAAGIVVLQVDDNQCLTVTPNEGPCAVSGYESAAKQLVSEGLVDPEKIGIIGFSRTCFYVMETLTSSSLHVSAASITDGVMETYFQYMMRPERFASEANSMIGAPPFGEGLQQWLKRSPGFNLDKVKAPLLVVGEGPSSTLFMWEPYAGLRYLQKPVDLIMLNTREHVLTNPAVRMASQGGSVDWFRFWLKGEEDPNPAKAAQYVRWRELRKLGQENEKAKR
jgi:dipeptidyl aminopeptidase/acylaminoacyl peptidase